MLETMHNLINFSQAKYNLFVVLLILFKFVMHKCIIYV
jgi:hypothetical protein